MDTAPLAQTPKMVRNTELKFAKLVFLCTFAKLTKRINLCVE